MHNLPNLIRCMDFLLNKLINEHTMLAMDLESKMYALIFSKAKSKHDKVS